jgi:hypothetical protein
MSDQKDQLAGKLREAHVQFLLSRLQDDGLSETIDRELAAAYEWGMSVTLNDIIDRELLISMILRLVGTAPFNEELRGIVVKSVITGIQSELNNGANIQSLVPKAEYDKAITHYAQFEKIRVDVIRMVLESPIYSELITDVLYHGIKDYVMTENVVVKKVPGVSALMKAGAKSLNKAMPKLEHAAEGTIKKFISGNLRSSVELSEKILNNALSENNIKTIADHFWETISEKDFSKFKHYVTDEDIDNTIAIGDELWTEVRQTDYLNNMIERIVEHVLDEIGDKKVADLVNDIGYTQEYISAELKQILPGSLAREALWQYLEARIRSSVDDFYSSAEFTQAVE